MLPHRRSQRGRGTAGPSPLPPIMPEQKICKKYRLLLASHLLLIIVFLNKMLFFSYSIDRHTTQENTGQVCKTQGEGKNKADLEA